MEWLSNILTSNNAIPVMVFALVVIIIGLVMVKKGTLSFNGKGVKIGAADNERAIIRAQFEFIQAYLMQFSQSFPKDLDEYRLKYVMARIERELIKMITFNHISDNIEYIRMKQDVIYGEILRRTDSPYFRSDGFKEACNKGVEDIIKRLLQIRKGFN